MKYKYPIIYQLKSSFEFFAHVIPVPASNAPLPTADVRLRPRYEDCCCCYKFTVVSIQPKRGCCICVLAPLLWLLLCVVDGFLVAARVPQTRKKPRKFISSCLVAWTVCLLLRDVRWSVCGGWLIACLTLLAGWSQHHHQGSWVCRVCRSMCCGRVRFSFACRVAAARGRRKSVQNSY